MGRRPALFRSGFSPAARPAEPLGAPARTALFQNPQPFIQAVKISPGREHFPGPFEKNRGSLNPAGNLRFRLTGRLWPACGRIRIVFYQKIRGSSDWRRGAEALYLFQPGRLFRKSITPGSASERPDFTPESLLRMPAGTPGWEDSDSPVRPPDRRKDPASGRPDSDSIIQAAGGRSSLRPGRPICAQSLTGAGL
jgi:hypothetical protein